MAKILPNKIIRHLASTHPDNRVRKWLFRLTNISIGSKTVVNFGFMVSDDYRKLLFIGERVAIASNVCIICCSNPNNSNLANLKSCEHLIYDKPIYVNDDVWIGANVTILGGVTIGAGAIIGANSLVRCDVPSGAIFAGVPAKKLGETGYLL